MRRLCKYYEFLTSRINLAGGKRSLRVKENEKGMLVEYPNTRSVKLSFGK